MAEDKDQEKARASASVPRKRSFMRLAAFRKPLSEQTHEHLRCATMPMPSPPPIGE